MVSNSRVEIKKFNGQNFELWNIKMEDLLVAKEQWAAVDLGTIPVATSTEDWEKVNRKESSVIHLYLSDLDC